MLAWQILQNGGFNLNSQCGFIYAGCYCLTKKSGSAENLRSRYKPKQRIMKEIEPCPLNGKDLVGGCIMDELFDNGEFIYQSKENEFLGLINKIPTVVKYEFGSSIIFVEPLDYDAEKREKVFRAVETYVKRFCKEEAHRKAGAKAETSQNFKFQAIKFFYYE